MGSRSFKFWEARQSEPYSREWQIGGSLWKEGDVVSLRLVDEGVPALPAVQNLQADVYWTEVHLSWDGLADRERFEKLCRVSRGHIQLITVSRFDASGDEGTFESIGEISFRRTDYIDSTVEFGKEYEYVVAMVCDGFDGQRISDHQTYQSECGRCAGVDKCSSCGRASRTHQQDSISVVGHHVFANINV